MDQFNFIELFKEKLENKEPNWYIKGLIDNENNLITLGTDTKLIGRIFELKCNSILREIAEENEGYELQKPDVQTEYPDFYYICPDNKRIAVDIKTTYLDKNKTTIKYTLGSYTSYLRDGVKNINGKYEDYKAHYVVGFVYDRIKNDDGVILPYSEESLKQIKTPYENVRVWVQEKYKIVGLTEGSGNTANIGSINRTSLDDFYNGNGPFSSMDESVSVDYWKNYKRKGPYNTIEKYFDWAKENSSLEINFINAQEQLYIEWRRNYCPTPIDKLTLATQIIVQKGKRGGLKALYIEINGRNELLSKQSTEIKKYIDVCKNYNMEIIENADA